MPNIVLVFVGGILVDRYGPGPVRVSNSVICLAGAALTAIGAPFALMAAGRLMFGIGAETMIVATIVALGIWFAGRQLAFAMALSISFARIGSYTVDVRRSGHRAPYASGWQAPLSLAAGIMCAGVVAAFLYWRLEAPRPRVACRYLAFRASGLELSKLAQFSRGYWYVLALCVLFYSVISISDFGCDYFQHTGTLR